MFYYGDVMFEGFLCTHLYLYPVETLQFCNILIDVSGINNYVLVILFLY